MATRLRVGGYHQITHGTKVYLENVQGGVIVDLESRTKSKLVGWAFKPDNSQYWIVEEPQEGVYTLKSCENGLYLTPPNRNNGSQITVTSTAHKWKIRPGSRRDSFVFESAAHPNVMMCNAYGKGHNGNTIWMWAFAPAWHDMMSWRLKYAPGEEPDMGGSDAFERKKEEEAMARREEEAKQKEVEAQKLIDEAKGKEAEARKLLDQAKEKEAEAQKLSEQARTREMQAQTASDDAKKREKSLDDQEAARSEQIKRREGQVAAESEAAAKAKADLDAKLEAIRKREEAAKSQSDALQKREEALAQREKDLSAKDKQAPQPRTNGVSADERAADLDAKEKALEAREEALHRKQSDESSSLRAELDRLKAENAKLQEKLDATPSSDQSDKAARSPSVSTVSDDEGASEALREQNKMLWSQNERLMDRLDQVLQEIEDYKRRLATPRASPAAVTNGTAFDRLGTGWKLDGDLHSRLGGQMKKEFTLLKRL